MYLHVYIYIYIDMSPSLSIYIYIYTYTYIRFIDSSFSSSNFSIRAFRAYPPI